MIQHSILHAALKNKQSIDHMLNSLDIDQYENLFQLLKNKESLYFTGVGKNLHIANIVASTFNSLTIRSIALDPVACVHGDMGLVEADATIVMVSKSGNTKELEFFCEKLKERNCGSRFVLIHSNQNATLKQHCVFDLFVPFLAECDPWNQVPTCSLVCYLSLLHGIGMRIIEHRGVTIEQFYRNHPGGDIGVKSKQGLLQA